MSQANFFFKKYLQAKFLQLIKLLLIFKWCLDGHGLYRTKTNKATFMCARMYMKLFLMSLLNTSNTSRMRHSASF